MSEPSGPVPADLAAPWSARRTAPEPGWASAYLVGRDGDVVATVLARRPVTGPLGSAYPAGARDVELAVRPVAVAGGGGDAAPDGALGAVLRVTAAAVLAADPRCRRVVTAVPAGDAAAVAVAEEAGFRYVVDVDLPGAELSLLVVEPDSVTRRSTAIADLPLGRP